MDTNTVPPKECHVAKVIKYDHGYVSDTSSAPPPECLYFLGYINDNLECPYFLGYINDKA